MPVLNHIAEDIAYKLGDQFNETLRESIKLTLLYYRSTYLKRDLEKNSNSLSYLHYVQRFTLDLEKVDKLKDFNIKMCGVNPECLSFLEDEDKYILKTKEKIPLPIRTKDSNKSGFLYTGNAVGNKPYIFSMLSEVDYKKDLPYRNKDIFWTTINKYGYILNALDICEITFEGVIEDPTIVYNFCKEGKFKDDNEFAISLDMMQSISNNIVKGEYPLLTTDGKEVNIEKDSDTNNRSNGR